MSTKNRGRPLGSSPNTNDDTILKATADKLVRVQVKTPTEAFKLLLEEGDEASLRRLQRKWKSNAEALIAEARKPFSQDVWKRDEKLLKESNPETYKLIKTLESSKGGRAYLLDKGCDQTPINIMSLGVTGISFLLKRTTMHGAEKAKEKFSEYYSDWTNFGSKPDSEFLRVFAELCLNKADELEAEKVGNEKGDKS